MNRLSLRNNQLKFKNLGELPISFEEIYETWLKLIKKNLNITTCRWSDLKTLGSWPRCPKIFLNTKWWGTLLCLIRLGHTNSQLPTPFFHFNIEVAHCNFQCGFFRVHISQGTFLESPVGIYSSNSLLEHPFYINHKEKTSHREMWDREITKDRGKKIHREIK